MTIDELSRLINMKLDEFKAKVFKQSTRFYAIGFNDGLLRVEIFWLFHSVLCAVEYDFNGDEVQYGPNDCTLLKVRPLFFQSLSPYPEGDTLTNSTVATAEECLRN